MRVKQPQYRIVATSPMYEADITVKERRVPAALKQIVSAHVYYKLRAGYEEQRHFRYKWSKKIRESDRVKYSFYQGKLTVTISKQ